MPRVLNGVCSIAALFAVMLGGAPGAGAGDDLAAAARDAYIYAFPLHEMYRVRYQALYNPANPRRAAVNRFLHRRALSDHTSRGVTTPNNDTIYSSAFLDLSQGPHDGRPGRQVRHRRSRLERRRPARGIAADRVADERRLAVGSLSRRRCKRP